MSERSHLPDSLRWRAVGWMEMELSQADATRRLNVSRSVVHRLWNQYQTKASVSRRHVPGRPQTTTLTGDRFVARSARRRRRISVPQLVADHSIASGRRISANESRFILESDSGHLLSWRERSTRYHQSNTVERHSYRDSGIMAWAGISLGGHTDLHVFQGGTLTDVRYREDIIDPYVHPYAGSIGNNFILIDDNARPHQVVIVEEYLEGLGVERMNGQLDFQT
ncbi:transposable element Tcb2 transposase [Trichonephila clavipes]|nr:transposable element Tcb2 transposase [Trichonephila clavipes]